MKLIPQLQAADQDWEFYPTTQEIIDAMLADLKREDPELTEADFPELDFETMSPRDRRRFFRDLQRDRTYESVLDIGAGHGKVLAALHSAKIGLSRYYAIEKSQILIANLPDYVLTVGTDFHEQTLYSKPVSLLFCNPPYSQFALWMERIIREAAAREIYFVVPRRWKDNPSLLSALKHRSALTHTVGSFDFEDAEDRRARAKVDLLRITFSPETESEAFDRHFTEQFSDLIQRFNEPKIDPNESWHDKEERVKEEASARFESLVEGEDYATRLTRLYLEEMARIRHHCGLISELDPAMLREFEIVPSKILECLKEKLKNLKHAYWNELFSRLTTVTDRLTSKSRDNLLKQLRQHLHVDFTLGNIQAVLFWVIKNANAYLDKQLISTYEQMIETANVKNYKSNTRAFVYDRWRYNEKAEKRTHFYLEFRLVLNYIGGIKKDPICDYDKGLDENACLFLGDLLTIARNLKFNCSTTDRRLDYYNCKEWRTGQKFLFGFNDKNHQQQTLFEVRAFYNRNLHVRLHPDFALALNVEYGRLKGWLKSGGHAAKELSNFDAARHFRTNHQLLPAATQHLLTHAA